MEFRRSLAASFLFRFFVHVATKLEADVAGYQSVFPDSYKSAAVPFHRPPVQGLQYYSKAPGEDVVGQPMRHMAADLQVSSEWLCWSKLCCAMLCHEEFCEGLQYTAKSLGRMVGQPMRHMTADLQVGLEYSMSVLCCALS